MKPNAAAGDLPEPTAPKQQVYRLVAGIAVLCVGIVAVGLLWRSVRNTALVETNYYFPPGNAIHFRLYRDENRVFASADEGSFFRASTPRQVVYVGDWQPGDDVNASITMDEPNKQVICRAGNKKIIFDLEHKIFGMPSETNGIK